MDSTARDRTAAMWNAGNYARLATHLAPAATTLADMAGAGDDRPALDLAAGTGSLAIALARAGWRPVAVDIADALVARGRATTTDLALGVDWHTAPLDEIPLRDSAVPLVGSSFGLIFAPQPQHALSEIHRVLTPDGKLLITSWPRDGYMAEQTGVIARFIPTATTAPGFDPFLWGDTSMLHTWLAEHFHSIETTRHQLPWAFPDIPTAVSFLFENSPGHIAAENAVAERAAEMRAAVSQHLAHENRGTGPVDLQLDYLTTVATAR